MARLTDRKRKQIVADYLETQSVNAAATRNGVAWDTAKRVLDGKPHRAAGAGREKEEGLGSSGGGDAQAGTI